MSDLATIKQWGFRGDTDAAAVREFQRAYNLGARLSVDGDLGKLTRAAVARVEGSGKLPRISEHFAVHEFRCHCGCGRTRVLRGLLQSLEEIRTHLSPSGLSIISGYRCPRHNRQVGGATRSQHLHGAAADLAGTETLTAVRGLHAVAGIGTKAGRVLHVDRRDLTTGGSVQTPTTWVYD